MRHYCTYFDKNYLLRGLTLFRSLQKHESEFVLWVLCCDEVSFATLQVLSIENLRPISLSEVEKFEPRLTPLKTQRSRVEYLWTLSPIWPLYLLENYPEIENLTYLDADLFFYSSPDPVFEEIGDAPISVFSHRYADKDDPDNINGVFNVGWVGYQRGETALACLRRWREQCLVWCFAYTDEGRYGDQKYLDEWPTLYPAMRVIEHKGAGIAPWNWRNVRFTKTNKILLTDGVPLVFFHFHGLRILNSWLYDTYYTTRIYGVMPSLTRRQIFDPYLETMTETARWARSHGASVDFGYLPISKYMKSYGVRTAVKKLARRQMVIYRGLK